MPKQIMIPVCDCGRRGYLGYTGNPLMCRACGGSLHGEPDEKATTLEEKAREAMMMVLPSATWDTTDEVQQNRVLDDIIYAVRRYDKIKAEG